MSNCCVSESTTSGLDSSGSYRECFRDYIEDFKDNNFTTAITPGTTSWTAYSFSVLSLLQTHIHDTFFLFTIQVQTQQVRVP